MDQDALALLFDSIPDALLLVDADGHVVIANCQAEQLFGYGFGELEGIAVERLMPPEARQRHRAHRLEYVAHPRRRPMGDAGQTLTGQRLDGRQFPVEIALSPLSTGHGKHTLASIRDVSETQRAREALVRARYDALVALIGQLALESGDTSAVVDVVPALLSEALDVEVVAVVVLRPDRNGIELRSSVGLDDDWPEWTRPLHDSASPLWEPLASGAPLVVGDSGTHADMEPSVPMADDARSGAIVALLDRDRPMGALLATSRDLRRFDHDALHLLQSVANLLAALMQRRRTEEQLAHSQRLDAIGQLTGGIAHDFNNLLTVVSGTLQLLEDETPQSAETSKMIATALRSIARGGELTAKLLAFARRQRLSPCAIDVHGLLRDLELMLARTLGDPIRIEVTCPAGLPCAFADPTQLDSALVNLALNARDAMPRGGELTLAAREFRSDAEHPTTELSPGRYIALSVSDTGHGMTGSTLARAVEPFFTTKDTGRGSGLGLSMVYGFVRQSGGYMQIDSRLGYGTRIDLYLPVAPASTAARPAATQPLGSGDGATILVVEDEPAVRSICSAFLHSLGYCVLTASNADEALAHLRRDQQIALLFSDVMLGDGMDGKRLAAIARRRYPRVAVLLTSGYEDPLAGETGDDADAFDLLRKPYRREQLAGAIARSLAPAAVAP